MPEDIIKPVDIMNYVFTPEQRKKEMEIEEVQIVARTMFKVPPGTNPFPSYTVPQFVAEMDKAGYDKVFIACLKMFSWRNKKLIMDVSPEEVHSLVKQAPGRLVGLAGYNPLRIKESLEEIERAVKVYGFKGIFAHSLGFGMAPNDRRYYPCYAKCVELDIPFSIQVGHSLETMPSSGGRPIFLDTVALDFPELKLIGSHTGWPWCEELIAMAWKWENIYLDISAHLPRFLNKSIVQFMDTRGMDKVLFGTNGFGFKLCKEQFLELTLKEETRRKVLRENAIRLFKLN